MMPAKKPEAPSEPRILIPSWERRRLVLKIEGLTPLMTDRKAPWVREDLQRKQEGLPAIPRPKPRA